MPRIAAWLAKHCRIFWWQISWVVNILFTSNIARNVNPSSHFDFRKTKGRHGFKPSRLYFIKNIILEMSYPVYAVVSPKEFSKSGLYIIIFLLRLWLSPFSSFSSITLQNFRIIFDITSCIKWNSGKISQNTVPSAILVGGWCHDVLKRCFSCQGRAGLKIIGPPEMFIAFTNFKKPFLLWMLY